MSSLGQSRAGVLLAEATYPGCILRPIRRVFVEACCSQKGSSSEVSCFCCSSNLNMSECLWDQLRHYISDKNFDVQSGSKSYLASGWIAHFTLPARSDCHGVQTMLDCHSFRQWRYQLRSIKLDKAVQALNSCVRCLTTQLSDLRACHNDRKNGKVDGARQSALRDHALGPLRGCAWRLTCSRCARAALL